MYFVLADLVEFDLFGRANKRTGPAGLADIRQRIKRRVYHAFGSTIGKAYRCYAHSLFAHPHTKPTKDTILVFLA